MGKNTVICRFTHCLHDEKEIDKDDAVKEKNAYYHKDCLCCKHNIAEIARVFVSEVNSNTVMSVLHATINDIVFKKGVDSEFLLFALNYVISHKMKLNYPQGMHYIIQNKEIISAYHKLKEVNEKKTFSLTENNVMEETSFTYIPSKKKTLTDILD